MVERPEYVDQADGIDIVDRRSIGVIAEAGRIAGQRDDVPDAHGVGADQVGLEAH